MRIPSNEDNFFEYTKDLNEVRISPAYDSPKLVVVMGWVKLLFWTP